MTEDMKAEMKKMMKEVMQEQLTEMQQTAASSEQPAVAKKKAASKAAPKTVFDETRAMGPDLRDPRMSKECWPCKGQHEGAWGNNRFGKWLECQKCGVRLSYVPAKDAPAQTTQVNLVQNVQEALHRLRMDGHEENDLTARKVKAMITIVAKEKIVEKKGMKDSGYKPSPKKEPLKVDLAAADSEDENAVMVEPEEKRKSRQPVA